MRNIFLIALLAICGCRPDGYKNGLPYNLHETCLKSHLEKDSGYHFGYYYFGADRPKFGFHWPYQCFYSCTKTICDQSKTDTVFLK